MMLKINNLLLFIMIGCFFTPNIVNGQSWNLPDDRVNNRFFSNGTFSIIRPGLTFLRICPRRYRGCRSSRIPTNTDTGAWISLLPFRQH